MTEVSYWTVSLAEEEARDLPSRGDLCDVGSFTDGWLYSLDRYLFVEAKFVAFVSSLIDAFGGVVRVANPFVNRPLPAMLGDFRNGSELAPDVAVELFKFMFRGGSGRFCWLVFGDLDVWVAPQGDLVLLLEARQGMEDRVLALLPPGLEVNPQGGPDPVLSRVADDSFWSEVARLAEGTDRLWVLEEWAQGPYGERWFRPGRDDLAWMPQLVRPNSVVRVGAFVLPTETVSLQDVLGPFARELVEVLDLRVLVSEGDGLALDVRPLDERFWAGHDGSPVTLLSARKWAQEDALAAGESVISAVVPDTDGRVWARWGGG